MKIVTIQEAKASFSKLIARVQRGEEIIISKFGKPVAKLSAYDGTPQPLVPTGRSSR